MKLFSMMMVCAFAIAGCGGKKPAETTMKKDDTAVKTDDAAKTAETPCAQEVALECPEGQIDGCLKTPAEGTNHACVAK